MSLFVVESSVAVKWFVPEEFSSQSSRLLDGGHEVLAPDTLAVATGKIITAKMSDDEITPDEAMEVVSAVDSAPVAIHPSAPLLLPGMEISYIYGCRLGDGINLSLAVQFDCRLVTAQQELYDVVQGTPFASHVKWVGDLR
jgi:predicted nucleic acid-binding protein